MALTRYFQKIFGKNSQGIGQFGSAINNTKVTSTNVETLQNLSNYEAGWESAVITNKNYPTYQEMNGLFYSLSYQLAYMFENGIPEYNNQTEYKTGSFVKKVGTSELYESLIDENINQPLTNVNAWKKFSAGGGLEVGDIGIAIFPIDETQGKRRYLNGTILTIDTNSQAFINKLKQVLTSYPNLGCTEAEWQEIASSSVGGQCGKFVLNETAGTLRLPKIVMPIQGIYDLAHLGDIVEAGLPNLKGSFWNMAKQGSSVDVGTSGVFALSDRRESVTFGSNSQTQQDGVDFDASLYNDIYSDNIDTVQQEQIQFPYYIQIATGQETEINIINQIELNNPYSLFDFKWADHELNNLSWIKADTFSWHSGTVYVDAYNKLLEEYNNGEEETEDGITFKRTNNGFKIANSSQETTISNLYNNKGIAWYYILDTANQRFKLPRTKFGLVGLRDNVGDFVDESLPNITGFVPNVGIAYTETTGGSGSIYTTKSDNNYGGTEQTNNKSNLNLNASLSSSTYQNGASVQQKSTQMYLYFYVGETVQNANLVNIGRIAEVMATKVDLPTATKASFPSNKYIDLTLGASGATYTAPADGWFYIFREGGTNKYVLLVNQTSGYGIQHTDGTNSSRAIFPVRKNNVVQVDYSSGSTTSFRFYYAEGEK